MPEPTRDWLDQHSEPDPHDGAHPSMELHSPQRAEVERVWSEYWRPIVADGGLERLKGELYDYHHLVDQARLVYRHVTGGTCDDLTASAEGIIAMAERQVEKRIEPLKERIRELEAELRRRTE